MKVRCPSCRQWTVWEKNSFRPFCSEECKGRDLGAWATEQFRIPVQEEPDFRGGIDNKKKASGEHDDED